MKSEATFEFIQTGRILGEAVGVILGLRGVEKVPHNWDYNHPVHNFLIFTHTLGLPSGFELISIRLRSCFPFGIKWTCWFPSFNNHYLSLPTLLARYSRLPRLRFTEQVLYPLIVYYSSEFLSLLSDSGSSPEKMSNSELICQVNSTQEIWFHDSASILQGSFLSISVLHQN